MAHGSDDKVTDMARAAKKTLVEGQQEAAPRLPESMRYDEDFTPEEWTKLEEISRKYMADEEFIWDVERAW